MTQGKAIHTTLSSLHDASLPLPPGYRSFSKGCPWAGVYIPAWNQIWIHPDAPRRQRSRILVHEVIHLSLLTLKPAQLVPLYAGFEGSNTDYSVFREIVESLFIAGYPLARGHPVNCRNLPWAPMPYACLGREMISLAIQLSQAEDSVVLPSIARQNALWGLVNFLLHLVPSGNDSGAEILARIRQYGIPSHSDLTRGVFAHLMTQAFKASKNKKESLFVVRPPMDRHTMFCEVLKMLLLILSVPVERWFPMLPSIMICLTWGIASFYLIVLMRDRADRIVMNIENWDQQRIAPGIHPLFGDTDEIALRHIAPECLALHLYLEYFRIIRAWSPTDKLAIPRLELFVRLPAFLKRLLNHYRALSSEKQWDCPICKVVLDVPETQELASRCLKRLEEKPEIFSEAAGKYLLWLSNGYLQEIHSFLGINKPIQLLAITRPPLIHLP